MYKRKEGKKNPTDFRIPVNVAAKLTFNIANIALSFNFVLIGYFKWIQGCSPVIPWSETKAEGKEKKKCKAIIDNKI